MGVGCSFSAPGIKAHRISCSRKLAWGKKLMLWASYSDFWETRLEQLFPVLGQLWEMSLFQRAPSDKKQAVWGIFLFSPRLKNMTLSTWSNIETQKVEQKAALTRNISVTSTELQKVWDFPSLFATHLCPIFSEANKNMHWESKMVFNFPTTKSNKVVWLF